MAKKPTFSDGERSLMDAIHDHPHEEAPYLAYAAWLETNGHPMAEYVRLCCEIERGGECAPRGSVLALKERAAKLEAAHGKEWGRPISRQFEPWGYTRYGMPYARARPLDDADWKFLDRADGWVERMSPRLFVMFHFISGLADRLSAMLAHPFMRRVHWVEFYLNDHRPGVADELARSIAGASVLDRLLGVKFSVPYFSEVSDEAWGLLAHRFHDIGSYSADAFACEMPNSEFTVERRPKGVIDAMRHEYRFKERHPSEAPPWLRTHRRLTQEEAEAMRRDILERWGDYYDYA